MTKTEWLEIECNKCQKSEMKYLEEEKGFMDAGWVINEVEDYHLCPNCVEKIKQTKEISH